MALASLGLSGCAEPRPAAPTPNHSVANDPVLASAAAAVQEDAEQRFADTFAGVTLDHSNRTMIVYRRPDPALEARVRSLAGDVRVTFRDARYSLAQLRAVVDRVAADTDYWRQNGVEVTSVAPRPDGSGVEVGVASGGERERQMLAGRYPETIIFLQERVRIFPTAEPAPPIRIGGTGSPSR